MRTIEDFKEEVRAHYTGQSFEVTVDRDPTSNSTGNGISYRSLYTILACLNSMQDAQDLAAFQTCMELREAGGGAGLYHRNPGDKTRNGIDDHVYAAAASCMIESRRSVARAMLEHYRVYRGHFDDQNPGTPDLKSWFGRYFWFYGFLQLCAGERPGLLDKTAMALSLFSTPNKDDAGGILLNWVQAKIYARAGGILGRLAYRSARKLTAMRDSGMAGVCADYFNRNGEPQHPLSWAEVWSRAET